jgi:hypothetical protein
MIELRLGDSIPCSVDGLGQQPLQGQVEHVTFASRRRNVEAR